MARHGSFVMLGVLLAAAAPVHADVTVTVHDDTVLHQVDERFDGTNFVALWHQAAPDAAPLRNAFGRLGMGLLRFPGGVPAHFYDWEQPLKSGWTEMTSQRVWDFAKAGGAQLILQTNTAQDDAANGLDSSAAHQAGWLAFAKSKGIQVAWWEIGNEPEVDAPDQHKGSQQQIYAWYNAKYAEQAKAIRAADPQARLLGPAATNTWFWWSEGNLEKFLVAHGDKQGSGLADGISLHWYPDAGKQAWNQGRQAAQGWQEAMDFIQQTIVKYDTRPLGVYITEWNWGGGQDNDSAKRLANALGCADIVGMFRRTGVRGHTHFTLHYIQNNWGMLATSGDYRAEGEPSPTYFALAMTSLLGRHVLRTESTADEKNEVSSYAAKDDQGNLQLLLINKTAQAQNVNLTFAAYQPAGQQLSSYTLVGKGGSLQDDDVIYNGVTGPKPATQPLPAPVQTTASSALTAQLSPYSMQLLVLAGGTPPPPPDGGTATDGAATDAAPGDGGASGSDGPVSHSDGSGADGGDPGRARLESGCGCEQLPGAGSGLTIVIALVLLVGRRWCTARRETRRPAPPRRVARGSTLLGGLLAAALALAAGRAAGAPYKAPPMSCSAPCRTLARGPIAETTVRALQQCGEDWAAATQKDCEHWDYLRNCIFADAGYPFKKPKWRKRFGASGWYKPNPAARKPEVPKTGRYNIKTLARMAKLCRLAKRSTGKRLKLLRADLDGDGKPEAVEVTDLYVKVGAHKVAHGIDQELTGRLRARVVDIDKSDKRQEVLLAAEEYETTDWYVLVYSKGGQPRASPRMLTSGLGLKGNGKLTTEDSNCGITNHETFAYKRGIFTRTVHRKTGKYSEGQCSACPFVYVRQGDRWSLRGEILRHLRGVRMERSQRLRLGELARFGGPDRRVRVRIAERKPEITYLDQVRLVVDGRALAPLGCARADGAYCARDGRYHLIHQGEALELEFVAPARGEATLVATGYYLPLAKTR